MPLWPSDVNSPSTWIFPRLFTPEDWRKTINLPYVDPNSMVRCACLTDISTIDLGLLYSDFYICPMHFHRAFSKIPCKVYIDKQDSEVLEFVTDNDDFAKFLLRLERVSQLNSEVTDSVVVTKLTQMRTQNSKFYTASIRIHFVIKQTHYSSFWHMISFRNNTQFANLANTTLSTISELFESKIRKVKVDQDPTMKFRTRAHSI